MRGKKLQNSQAVITHEAETSSSKYTKSNKITMNLLTFHDSPLKKNLQHKAVTFTDNWPSWPWSLLWAKSFKLKSYLPTKSIVRMRKSWNQTLHGSVKKLPSEPRHCITSTHTHIYSWTPNPNSELLSEISQSSFRMTKSSLIGDNGTCYGWRCSCNALCGF